MGIPRSILIFWKFRWPVLGIFYFYFWLLISFLSGASHSTGPENYYSIGWSYVSLVVGIISLMYPLALSIRQSLTTRFFEISKLFNGDVGIILGPYRRLQDFRRILFDQQLPFIACFSAASVVRVMLCLINVGPLSTKQQMLEPQVYVIGYLFWAFWAAFTFIRLKPFVAVEEIEAKYCNLPNFEISFSKKYLNNKNNNSI